MKKLTSIVSLALILSGATLSAQSIKFGNDSGDYSNDWECDDPRFEGFGMSSDLSDSDIRKDASDCKRLLKLGEIYVLNLGKASAATQCSKINFGNDDSQYASDGQCDDRRFFGGGAASTVAKEHMYRDAKDCRKQCESGNLFVRRY